MKKVMIWSFCFFNVDNYFNKSESYSFIEDT